MLKSKISSAHWSTCDVMLRDYEESQRLFGASSPGLIISQLYWPFESDRTIVGDIPPAERSVDAHFRRSHQHRKLVWRPELARMLIKVPFSNGAYEFDCLDIQGNILIWISDHDGCVSMEEILAAVSGSYAEDEVESAVKYWLRKRVILVQGDHFAMAKSWSPDLPGTIVID